MRKVLSFVLVLSLVLGSFGMAFAAPLSDIAGEDFEDAVNVLTELGVVKGYPDGTYKPENIVTRAEMAVIVVSALGLADYATGTAKFSDMAGHWSNPYVAYATSLGVIAGYPDGTFKPDKTVSYDEAATMLVAALGYTADSLVGTWPANFVTKAKTLGILDGIKAGAAGANRGDIAIMTYQTLDQAIGKTNKDGDFVATNLGTVAAPVADVMLERLGAEVFGVTAAFPDGTPFVVDDTDADDAVADIRDLVGAYVTAYINDDGDIIAIKEVKSTFLTGNFDTAGVGVVGAEVPTVGGIFTNDADDKEYDLRGVTPTVLAATEYFLNGKASTAAATMQTYAVASEDDTYKIAVDISGSKIDEVYSVSEWSLTDDFVFEDGDLDDDNIDGNYFTLDDDDNIDLSSFVLLGVDSLENIEEDDIVYVYSAGAPAKITKIEVGTETATGVVTRIKSGDYTVGGEVYSFAASFAGTAPKIDDEIEMTLDYAGDIYDYEIVSGESDLYGIVLRTGVASEDMDALGASDAEIELFLADGTKKTFVVDYGEIEDNTAATGIPNAIYNEGAIAASPADDAWLIGAGDVIEYDLNKDGEIEKIDWIADADNAGAGPAVPAGSTAVLVGTITDLTAKGYYDGYAVASDATIMTYSDITTTPVTTDEDDYGVATRSALLDSEIPADAFYVLDSGKIVFMYIDGGATAADDVFGVLVDAEENASDAGWGVDMLIDGLDVFKNSNVNYTTAAMDLLYLVEYDVDGDVSLLTPMTLTPGTDYNRSARTAAANTGACSVSGNVISVATAGDLFDINGLASTTTEITLDEDVAVYEWSEADGTYSVAKISDIKGMVEVAFFDTVDDDGVYDIVLIMDDATVLPY